MQFNLFQEVQNFVRDIIQNKSVIVDLAKRDLKVQHAGALLGPVWIYLQPLLFTLVIYIVFTIGFRSRPLSDSVPHSVWLLSGMVSWLFFSSYLSVCAGLVTQYSFLVKKIDFNLSILPIVKVLSGLPPHLTFVVIAIGLAAFNGIYPSLYTFQLTYYFSAMCILVMSVGWLTSSINLFIPDVAKIVQLIVQFGFWLTPVFWDVSQVPEKYHWIINANPMFYVVNGYRDSIIYNIGFWEHPEETLYFWSVTLVLCLLGARVYSRLRPHFAEVI
jgi:lipopolysaccharide transport system permease protein/teichoic acid transport system permease protein